MGRGLSWRRLGVLVEALATTPGTRLFAELSGSDWTREEQLLALIADVLAIANWQRQGRKGAPKPKPVSPQPKASAPARDPMAGRTQQDIDGLLEAMRTNAFGG